MNIRLDKDVRIRIDHEDLGNLKRNQYIAQEFRIGVLHFKLSIQIKSDNPGSDILYQTNEICISLGQRDAEGVLDEAGEHEDITIDGVCLQVDKWGKQKREKYNNVMKGNQ